jgi:hypothetical protein
MGQGCKVGRGKSSALCKASLPRVESGVGSSGDAEREVKCSVTVTRSFSFCKAADSERFWREFSMYSKASLSFLDNPLLESR